MKIFKLFYGLATLILLNVQLFGQDSLVVEIESDTTSAEAQARNSLLWKITGNGLSKPSYLFGTIHIIDKDDFFFTEEMQKAFGSCEAVTFEIKIDDMMNLGAMFSVMKNINMDNGVSLRDLLSEEEYKMVKNHFDQMNFPFFIAERMKPMFLSAMASGEGSPESMKLGKTVSYELELMNNAKKQKKPISGLETMEFQMGLFDSIPYDVQAQMLVESIKVGSTGGDDLEEMTRIYKSQDIEAMQSMMSSDTEGIGRYEELLLTKRNENWIPKMKTQMKDKAVFFAVGAGHLGGEKGVIQLLEKEGYTLTPVK